jgi:hypothetical protein
MSASVRVVLLDGETLTPEQIMEIGENPSITVDLTDSAWKAVTRARAVVDRVLQRREVREQLDNSLIIPKTFIISVIILNYLFKQSSFLIFLSVWTDFSFCRISLFMITSSQVAYGIKYDPFHYHYLFMGRYVYLFSYLSSCEPFFFSAPASVTLQTSSFPRTSWPSCKPTSFDHTRPV